VLYHLKTKSERILYKDWNIGTYRWSPDGRWIAFERTNRHSNTDIYILSLRKGAKPFNVSRFPDYNMSPVWSANGRVLAYLSRNINNRFAIHYVYLRHTDHEKSNAERKQACKRWAKLWKRNLRKPKKRKKPTRTAKPSTAPTSRPAKVTKSTKKAKKKRKKRRGLVRITQLNRLPFRIRSVPFTPGFDGARGLAISPTGCAFVFGARGRNVSGLYRIRYDGTGLKRLAKGSFKKPTFTRKGKTFFLSRSGTLMMAGRKRAKAFRFRAEMIIDQAIAYKQKFMEGWSLLNEWFYDPTFHGAKWSQLRDEYGSLLKHITNNVDFDILSNMLLGELNASHLGMYSRYRGPRNHTGDIGAGFVPASTGKGLRVVYVRKWGPASHRKSKLYPGDVLLAIDGKPVSVRTNIYASLNHRAGRYVALTVKRRNGKVVTFAIQPVGQRQAHIQRYRTWMDGVRAKVKRLSGGALSYAHIRSMNMTSLARFERALAAHTYGTKALVIDVRNNGGGWIADLLLAMFFPKAHGYTQWRGSRKGYPMGRRPFLAWYKPSILLCNQRSVSNAEIFSHAYKNLKLGTLVGMPTYGGVISTRTLRILDKTWFRIPLRGWWALPTKKNMENGPAVPNVLVPLTPADEVNGRDPQLRKSIQLLMKQLAAKQAKK
jgi:tricorn protease